MYFHVFVRWYEFIQLNRNVKIYYDSLLIEIPSKQNRIILTYANEYVVEIVFPLIFNAVILFDERTS